MKPETPYAFSKALGEVALRRDLGDAAIIYRPTSVHGPDRKVTRALAQIAQSPLSSVAGNGSLPTPQCLVRNVAAAALFLADGERPLPQQPVMHPWEGQTTGSILRGLGRGRDPIHVPMGIAKHVMKTFTRLSKASAWLSAQSRRLEMLWFGQRQSATWFDAAGFHVPQTWASAFQEMESHADAHQM